MDAPKYEWEGKLITEEEANSLRRQYEQTARKWNRETKSFNAAAWKAMDAGNETLFFDMSNSAAYAQNKLKQWKDRLRELNATTGGKTDTNALSVHNAPAAEKVKPGAMKLTRKIFEENIEKAQTVRQFVNRVATLAVWLKDKSLAEGKTEQEAVAEGFKVLYEYADKKGLTPNEQQTLTRMFVRNTAYYLKDAKLKEELLRVDLEKISGNASNWLTKEEKNDIIKIGEVLSGLISKGENDIIKSGEGKDGRGWRESVFVTAKEIEEATGMSRKAAEGVRRALDYTSKKGHSEKCEIMVTLSAADGKNLGCEVIGQLGRITDKDKGYPEWFHLVSSSRYQTLTVVHNHNNISPLSEGDLYTFLKYDSIKYMFAVDMGGNVYSIKKTNATKNDAEKMKEKFEELYEDWEKKLHSMIAEGNMTDDEVELMCNSVLFEIYNILHAQFNFEWKEWKK